jgi:hypothetical protein
MWAITKQSYIASKVSYVCLNSSSHLFSLDCPLLNNFSWRWWFSPTKFPTHSGCLVIMLRRESWLLLQSLGNGVMSTVTFCSLTASLLCCSGVVLKNPSVTSRSCNIRFADNLQVWESNIILSLRTYFRTVCLFCLKLIKRMLDVKNVGRFY